MRKHGFLLAVTAALAISMCGCQNVNSDTPAANLGETEEQTSSDAPFLTVVPNSSVGNTSISGDFIETLNSVIDSSEDIEALNRGIKSADTENRIGTIQVFEHSDAFIDNVTSSDGRLNDGAIVYVSFNDGNCYITSWHERTTEPVPLSAMFMNIVKRAGSVEQLAAEIDGYNQGLGDRKVTNISLYKNDDDARDGNDLGETIIENGKPVASDSVWENSGVVRVTYDRGESWVCFSME